MTKIQTVLVASNLLTITVQTYHTLYVGNKIIGTQDNNTYIGYVSLAKTNDEYDIKFSTLPNQLNNLELSVVQWWKKAFDPITLLKPNFLENSDKSCYLEVQCARSSTGYLSWDLYFNNSKVIRGNDINNPGWCLYQSLGLFPRGNYRLEVTQQYKSARIGYGSVNWTLNESSNILECGLGKACPVLEIR